VDDIEALGRQYAQERLADALIIFNQQDRCHAATLFDRSR
jgi:hypothetical protein